MTEGLPPHPALAAKLRGASVAKVEGSWSDVERAAGSCTGDLPGGLLLHAATVDTFTNTAATLAVASPLSAALGLTDLTPLDPGTLQLTDAEARALCDTCSEHLRAEDIDLTFVDAHRWLISCNHPVNVLTERPDWLIGENLRPNLPRGTDARLVERWMNELQMLLYTHPVNIAREDRGCERFDSQVGRRLNGLLDQATCAAGHAQSAADAVRGISHAMAQIVDRFKIGEDSAVVAADAGAVQLF